MFETRFVTRLTALCGVAGTAALSAYFIAPAFLNWPYAGASPAQLTAYALDHQSLFYAGAWLQSTGTLLCVVFFMSLVRLSGALNRLPGILVVVASTALLSIVLVESALMVAVPMAASAGDSATVATTFALSNGVFLRVYPLAPASATYLAMGLMLLTSGPLHRGYGHAALALGAAFELAGIAAIFTSAALIVIAVLAACQVVWIIAAAAGLWMTTIASHVEVPIGSVAEVGS
jgi:hypothetical protein